MLDQRREARMRRFTALTAALLSAMPLVVMQAPPALACSCRSDVAVKDALLESDGAFVGRFLGRDDLFPQGEMVSSGRPVLNHFQVERSVKGGIGERVRVEAAASGASCGLELEVGERTGLFLRQGPNGWRSSLCSQIDPGALLTFVADEPDRETQSTGGRDARPFIVIGLAVVGIPTFIAIRRAFRRS